MNAVLYYPGLPPRNLPAQAFALSGDPNSSQVISRVALELDCSPGLVDVLDTGPGYAAYSIFDHEGEINESAIHALNRISQYGGYDAENENTQLRGPILLLVNK